MMDGRIKEIVEQVAGDLHVNLSHSAREVAETAAQIYANEMVKAERRPLPVLVTAVEGGEYRKFGSTGLIHSIRFSDGSEFDAFNGWRSRPETSPGAPEFEASIAVAPAQKDGGGKSTTWCGIHHCHFVTKKIPGLGDCEVCPKCDDRMRMARLVTTPEKSDWRDVPVTAGMLVDALGRVEVIHGLSDIPFGLACEVERVARSAQKDKTNG